MNVNLKNLTGGHYLTILAVIVVLGMTTISFGQTETQPKPDDVAKVSEKKETAKALKPQLTDYKEVKIGMTADEVKEKLGKPKVADKDGFLYIFSDEEQAQIGLDENEKVKVIAVIYSDKDGIAPKYIDVFGEEPESHKQPNGNIYNLVRYPAAGFWVAYSRVIGDDPTVTITIQKMRTAN